MINKLNNLHAEVALISPCWVLESAIRAMLRTDSASVVWHHQWMSDTSQSLLSQPPDLLIVSLYAGQAGLLQGLQFIQTALATWPRLRLLVTLDVVIPYLVTRLRALGEFDILYLVQPLAEWQARFHQLLSTAMLPRVSRSQPLQINNSKLSLTERRVMSYLLQGFCIPDIAVLLMCSVKKVTNQKCRAMHKLGIEHYAQLVAIKEIFMASPLAIQATNLPPAVTDWSHWEERKHHLVQQNRLS